MRTITIYSRPDCQPCKRIKSWWQRKTDIHWQGLVLANLEKYTLEKEVAA